MVPDTFNKTMIQSMVLLRTTYVPGLCFPPSEYIASPEPFPGDSLPLQEIT